MFVTGAAGFVGKGLVEKLLWGCRDIRKVYILLRHKRGKDAAQRLQDMLQLPVSCLKLPSRPTSPNGCILRFRREFVDRLDVEGLPPG